MPNETTLGSEPSMAATGSQKLPALYASLEALSSERHRNLRVRQAGFAFARGASAIPVTIEEFTAAARTLPIVFTAKAPHLPMAVTSFSPAESGFIESDGRWRSGAYIPAYLRRYPFYLMRTGAAPDQHVLCIDAKAPHFSEDEGAPLFDPAGKPAPALTHALSFCRSAAEAFLRTRAFSEALAEAGLLKPSVVEFTLNGKSRRIDGFFAVDRAALMALPPDKIIEFQNRGWLEAIYAHLLSTRGLSTIAQASGVFAAA